MASISPADETMDAPVLLKFLRRGQLIGQRRLQYGRQDLRLVQRVEGRRRHRSRRRRATAGGDAEGHHHRHGRGLGKVYPVEAAHHGSARRARLQAHRPVAATGEDLKLLKKLHLHV
jgi:hypothetical protein